MQILLLAASVCFPNAKQWGSLYRYQYGIQIGDSIGEDVIREYPDLFRITKIVSRYLEQMIGLPVPAVAGAT